MRFVQIALIAFAAIALRRWQQFLNPGVWVEDGAAVLPSFVVHGWAGLLVPVQGYLVLACKLVSYTALQLSFSHYALVSTILTTAVQASCVGAVACAPTVLPARRALALAIVLLPTGPEVFGITIFVLWWTTLLIVLALFWRPDARQWPQLAGLALGALSSPMIIVLTPLFVLRALVERRRSHIVTALAAAALAAIQALVVWHEQAHQVSPFAALAHPDTLVAKYLGTALSGLDQPGAALLGTLIALFLIAGLVTLPPRDRFSYLLLGLCLGGAIASSVARVPLAAPHPIYAAPRYFFFPLLFVIWMQIWLIARSPSRPFTLTATACLALYLPLLARSLSFSDQIPVTPWPKQVKACAKADDYTFQLEYAGWSTTLKGSDCRRLIRQSVIG